MLSFANPSLLLLLLVPPLLALLRGREGKNAALSFSSVENLAGLGSARVSKAGRWLSALRLASLTLLVAALAGPRLVWGSTEIEASGIDIVLGLDVSGSMEALDFKLEGRPVSRVDVVKSVVAAFVSERPNDRIGMVAFAGRPYVVSPVTLDHDWLERRLKDLRVGLVEDGTAIGSALALAVNRLREQEAKSKIVVLLTDGMNNAGKVQPLTAAEAAKALGIKVYTIGAGTRGQAPVPVTDMFGRRQLAMAQVDIDEDTLKKISEMTGAQYFRATDTQSLQRIYEEINKLETTTRRVKKYQDYEELFMWLAGAALALLMLETALRHGPLRSLP